MGSTPNTAQRLAASDPGPRGQGPQPAQPKAGRKPRLLDDDLDLDLPDGEGDERDTVGAADDTWNPDDDSDLGLDDLEGPDDVGLDTATGLEDTNDTDLDLDDAGEGERWTADSEEVGDLAEDDAEVAASEEYGWLGEDEPAAEDDAFDPDLTEDDMPTLDDGGAEGLDDDADMDAIDEAALPRLDSSSDEEPDDLGIETLDDLHESAAGEETLIDVGGVACRKLPARCVRRTDLSAHESEATTSAYASNVTDEVLQALPFATRPAVMLDEDGGPSCYCCVPHGGSTLIVRRVVQAAHLPPMVLIELDAAFGAVRALSAACVEGLVTLHVENARGWHLIEASLDGEDLA